MRILVATDAWHPQVNGVVRSIEALVREAPALGATLGVLTPEGLPSWPAPTYPDIRLAVPLPSAIARRIEAFGPDHIHLATEGPIGLAVRRHCRRHGLTFTTSYHTQFPDYLAARLPIPRGLTYAALRWFHGGAACTMVSTPTVAEELRRHGFSRLLPWSRGVDPGLFHPRQDSAFDWPRPIFLFVGRVAVEKNLDAFLSLDLPGTKVVAGDGPARSELESRYPSARFIGMQTGEALARAYASADVFVFPSRTDTFGIVLLEALASGLPVAAFPVRGPKDVIGDSAAGVLDEDLRRACLAALAIPPQAARDHALRFSWTASTRQFLDNVSSVRAAGARQPGCSQGRVRRPALG